MKIIYTIIRNLTRPIYSWAAMKLEDIANNECAKRGHCPDCKKHGMSYCCCGAKI